MGSARMRVKAWTWVDGVPKGSMYNKVRGPDLAPIKRGVGTYAGWL
jgi:hypothetical protein